MLIRNNPATAQLHEEWRERLFKEFPGTDFSKCMDYLSLINYLDQSPQKYYSKEAYAQYLNELERIKRIDPKILAAILSDTESLLSIANKF